MSSSHRHHRHHRQRHQRTTNELPQPVILLLEKMFQESYGGNQAAAYAKYKTLNSKIRLLPTYHDDHKMICKYVENGHGPTHNIKVNVQHIYTVSRFGEYKEYKKNKRFRHRRLLWHGSQAKNFPSILQNGLLLKAPAGTTETGKMFGQGVYFADVVTKSSQYCRSTDSYGLLLLAEVALGKHWYLTSGQNVQELKYGKYSVKGLGRYKPDSKQTIRNKYGAQVPLGPLKLQTDLQTSLEYSEYIVYQHDQILIEYLVLVTFNK